MKRRRAALRCARAGLLGFAFIAASQVAAFDLQGHRGARGLAPENTLPAFARALSIGVTTLELDVGVTRDGVVVVAHDPALNPEHHPRRARAAGSTGPGRRSISLDLRGTPALRRRPRSSRARAPRSAIRRAAGGRRRAHSATRRGLRADRTRRQSHGALQHRDQARPRAPRRHAAARAVRACADRRDPQGGRGGAHDGAVVRLAHAAAGAARGTGDADGLPDGAPELARQHPCRGDARLAVDRGHPFRAARLGAAHGAGGRRAHLVAVPRRPGRRAAQGGARARPAGDRLDGQRPGTHRRPARARRRRHHQRLPGPRARRDAKARHAAAGACRRALAFVERAHRVLGDLLQEGRGVPVDLAVVVVGVAHRRACVQRGVGDAGREVGADQVGMAAVVILLQLEARLAAIGFLERQADRDHQRTDAVAGLDVQLLGLAQHVRMVVLVRRGVGVRHVKRGLGAARLDQRAALGHRLDEGRAALLGHRRGAVALQHDHLEGRLDAEHARLEVMRQVVLSERAAGNGDRLVAILFLVRLVVLDRHAPHVVVQAVAVIQVAVADEQYAARRVDAERSDLGCHGIGGACRAGSEQQCGEQRGEKTGRAHGGSFRSSVSRGGARFEHRAAAMGSEFVNLVETRSGA